MLWLLMSVSVAAAPCDGTSPDWLGCRKALISSIFNSSTLPAKATPDYIIHRPDWVMTGFPGPGNGVGDVSGNSWTNNFTEIIWTMKGEHITLNSTVFHTLNTSGAAPRNWPQDGPSMPGPSISPQGLGDTVVIYHNGHETNKCTPNFDGVVDYLNEAGYDVMELYMPLFGCNADTPYGQPYNHEWFEQWERLGEITMRFFIEPMVLTINYAQSLGYKHIVLLGLSGGGWTTTVTAAVDPRIKLSIPIAGSVPKWPTPLYPFEVPDLPELVADYEQRPVRPMYASCGFVCMYILAALESDRAQAQILHNQDPCCYQAQFLHPEIKKYNHFVQSQLRPLGSGWMQTMVTAGNVHQVNQRDKVIACGFIEKLRRNGSVKSTDFVAVPFDLLQVQ